MARMSSLVKNSASKVKSTATSFSNKKTNSFSGGGAAAAAATEGAAANVKANAAAKTQSQTNSMQTQPTITPTAAYNDADLRAAGKADPIDHAKAMWAKAKANNDVTGMQAAHAMAEQYRAQQGGYSGGSDGSQYIPTPQDTGSSVWETGLTGQPGNSALTLNAYDLKYLSPADQTVMLQLKRDYMNAPTAEEKQRINREAEKLRGQYGYSLGRDGATFTTLPTEQDMMSRIGVPSYEAQTEAVNQVYDKLNDATLAQLLASYNNSRAEAEYQMGRLPQMYQAQRNAVAADHEREKAAFREQAAASGLTAGNRSQAALAFSNALQNSLGNLNTAEANALAGAQNDLTQLYNSYQQQIASAVAQNNYERAAALLGEYQTAQKSRVDSALQQAGLDMQVADFNRATRQQSFQNNFNTANALLGYGDWTAASQLGGNTAKIASYLAAQDPETYYILKARGYL